MRISTTSAMRTKATSERSRHDLPSHRSSHIFSRRRMTDLAKIGERLRTLRLVSGLGQAEFAEQIDVANGSISKLENGRMAFSDDLINSMAKALDCSSTFLTTPPDMVAATRPWLRAYADAPKRAVDRQLAECTLATEVADTLGLRAIPDTIPVFSDDLTNDDAIEEFAQEVRNAAQIDDGAVVVNMIRAAERLGCFVLPMREELGRHVGLSSRANLVPLICVSRPSVDPERNVPGDRQRFTVAHELGHLALHGGMGPPASSEEARRIEKQAHHFAAAFLTPADAMLDELAENGGRVTLQTLVRIKERWGVAVKMLVMRFRTLGVIDANQARSLYKQISSRGWNKGEPVPVGNEEAIWLRKSIGKLDQSAADPLAAAAERIGLGRAHLVRWTDWSPTGQGGPGAEILQFRRH